MKQIIIIGNSGAARECYWLLQDVFSHDVTLSQEYTFAGFLSWKGYVADLKELHTKFLGNSDEHHVCPETLYIIGIASPQLRQQVFEEFSKKNAQFMNLIHPTAYICPSASMGQANILQRSTTLYCNAKLGNGNYLNGSVNLAHDATVKDFNLLGPGSMVLGNAQVGSANQLAPHCILLNNTTIGNNNILAPNTCIYKGCRDNCRMMGSPALSVGKA